MPGDVVRRMIPGKDTQRGYCHEIFVKADVKARARVENLTYVSNVYHVYRLSELSSLLGMFLQID